jgi:hypothetical protein
MTTEKTANAGKSERIGRKPVGVAMWKDGRRFPAPIPPAFWPRNIWPWCTRVIVLGVRLFFP